MDRRLIWGGLAIVLAMGGGLALAVVIRSVGFVLTDAMIHIGLLFSALGIAGGMTGITYVMRPIVLPLRTDPPPTAHYVTLDPDAGEDEDTDKATKAALTVSRGTDRLMRFMVFS
jgi:hypothetical protein